MEGNNWAEFCKFFTRQNAGRRTRLGVFELKGDVVNDFWLEDGLPFIDIDIDHSNEVKNVRINIGEMSHEINDAVKISAYLTAAGSEDGLDILDRDNRVTILRFETRG